MWRFTFDLCLKILNVTNFSKHARRSRKNFWSPSSKLELFYDTCHTSCLSFISIADNTSLAFITPNFTSNVKPHPNGFLGPNQGLSTNTPKGLIAQGQTSLNNVNPSMAGQCQPGKVFKEVTLKGGINAGTYKDVGSVKSMEECSSKCCEFAACDLAFMLSSRCYLVGCSEGKNCQIQKAKPSPYHPSVTYIERWNKEGVKHSGN